MRGIHINAGGNEDWVGGLYYKRNLVFSLLQNDWITKNYIIYVTVPKKYDQLFCEFGDNIALYSVKKFDYIYRIKHLFNLLKYRIAYSYPSVDTRIYKILGIRDIQWIPDLQHKFFSEFFSKTELDKRDSEYKCIDKPLVLSSFDALKSYELFYPKRPTYVVHFVSYIEHEIKSLNYYEEMTVLNSYRLRPNSYICVSNQFWQHKNHIVVLKAIEMLAEKKPDFDLTFVFTGEPKDYRNPEYYVQLLQMFEKPELKRKTEILGFIDRVEQLIIMKNSKFIVQPSLFEGWGTVVEDAKVLDKLILLSDIPVHHEQMNENCTLFNPQDPEDLADKIIEMSAVEHADDVEKGIGDMYVRAKEYSKGFQQLLEDYK